LRRAQTAITKLRIQHKFLRFFASTTLEKQQEVGFAAAATPARRIPYTHTLSLSLAPFFAAAEKRVKKFLRRALKNRPQLRDLFNPNFSALLTAGRLGSWAGRRRRRNTNCKLSTCQSDLLRLK
jgi:hypothetical protein